MSGYGQREAQLRAEAVAWRDRVSHDMTSAACGGLWTASWY
jgi:hypothetical protein